MIIDELKQRLADGYQETHKALRDATAVTDAARDSEEFFHAKFHEEHLRGQHFALGAVLATIKSLERADAQK